MAEADEDHPIVAQRKNEARMDVPVEISVVLGKANLRVNQLLRLGRGAVVELEQRTNDPVEVYANDILIAKAEVIITANDRIGITLTEIMKSLYTAAEQAR